MSRPSAAAYVCRPHVASARARIRAAWPAVGPSGSSRTSPDWSMPAQPARGQAARHPLAEGEQRRAPAA